jgi:hypothetical protein
MDFEPQISPLADGLLGTVSDRLEKIVIARTSKASPVTWRSLSPLSISLNLFERRLPASILASL